MKLVKLLIFILGLMIFFNYKTTHSQNYQSSNYKYHQFLVQSDDNEDKDDNADKDEDKDDDADKDEDKDDNADKDEDKDDDEAKKKDDKDIKDSDKKKDDKVETKEKPIVLSNQDLIEINKIKKGNGKYLATIRFHIIERLVKIINSEAKKSNKHPLDYLGTLPTEKIKLLKSFLGGLYNSDPRIRMLSSNSVKLLIISLKNIKIPEKTNLGIDLTEKQKQKLKLRYNKLYIDTVTAIQKITRRAWYIETVNKKIYLTLKITGEPVKLNTYKVINSLDLYVTREIVLIRLKNGTIQPKDFIDADPRIFATLTEKMDESDDVPIYSVEKNLEILMYSLQNEEPKVKIKASNLLVLLYHSPGVDNQTKNRIDKARKKYPELDKSFNDYVKKELDEIKKKEDQDKKTAVTDKKDEINKDSDDKEDVDKDDSDDKGDDKDSEDKDDEKESEDKDDE